MDAISENNLTDETFEMFSLETFQMPTFLLEDSLVQLFRQQGNAQDFHWRTLEAHSLLRCFASLGISEYHISSLKMSKDSSTMTEEEPLESYSKSWMRWGMTVNGSCLTAKISESRNTEKGYSLSDILEDSPDPKYSLSEEQVEAMMKRTKKNKAEGRGFSPTFLRPLMPTTTKEETLDLM